jgi:hypothetical protein
MKKLLIIIIVLCCTGRVTNAQSKYYQSAIGARVGAGYYDLFSASYKTFITEPGAIELNLGFRNYGLSNSWFDVSFSASYQHHFEIEAVEGLRWFIGGGIVAYNSFSSYSDHSGFGLGVFPTGGVDYKFANIPLNVSADIRPTIGLIRPYDYYNNFYLGNVGVSARYTFR